MPGRLEVRFNDSRAVEPESLVDTEFNQITADYFDTFDIPVRAGRVFTRTEALAGAPVAVISQALATRHWSGRDPVGRALHLSAEPDPRRIIGVVGDVVERNLRLSPTPTVYLPLRTYPQQAAYVNIRLQGDVASGLHLLREHVARLDHTMALPGPTTFAGMRRAA